MASPIPLTKMALSHPSTKRGVRAAHVLAVLTAARQGSDVQAVSPSAEHNKHLRSLRAQKRILQCVCGGGGVVGGVF